MEQNSKDIDEAAEALAEKEYPIQDVEEWCSVNKDSDITYEDYRVSVYNQRSIFIKGYKAANPKPINPNIEQALINLEEYFSSRSDADYEFNDIDGRYNPNDEMGLLNDVQVIKKYFGIE